MLVAVALQRVERAFSGITEANFHVSPASATAKVAVFKQIEHGFTASGKSPEVSLSLLISLSPRNLRKIRQNMSLFTIIIIIIIIMIIAKVILLL